MMSRTIVAGEAPARSVGGSRAKGEHNTGALLDEIKFPITTAQALRIFSERLNDFEKGEILDYQEIYYMGKGTRSGRKGAEPTYDDDKGDYNAYVGEQLAYRYEIVGVLGKGSFGQAIKCVDHKTQQVVAIKVIRSKKRFYRQAIVEVKVLKYIKEHDPKESANMVKMHDYFTFRKHIVSLPLGFDLA